MCYKVNKIIYMYFKVKTKSLCDSVLRSIKRVIFNVSESFYKVNNFSILKSVAAPVSKLISEFDDILEKEIFRRLN